MPLAAKRAQIGLSSALDADDRCGLERIALGAIATFAGAHAAAFFLGRFLHEREFRRV
jgi:hypothetical protein